MCQESDLNYQINFTSYPNNHPFFFNYDRYNVLNCNTQDGVIIIKDISKNINYNGINSKSGYKIKSAEVSWDLKIILSLNGMISISQENMHIKYIALNNGKEYAEIVSFKDEFEASSKQIQSKKDICQKNIEKEIKRLTNSIKRNKNSLDKQDREDRKQKLIAKITDIEDRLKQLQNKEYVSNLIHAEVSSVLNKNLVLYFTE